MSKKRKDARLNLQAISRRDKGLMGCMLPDPGMTIVSLDLVSGEPSVTANFSRDKNYRWATVDGIGRAPFYENGTLMIDDIYLQTMSVSPLGSAKMKAAFAADWGGRTFAEQWLADPETIKTVMKKDRQVHKILCMSECTLVHVKGQGLVPIKQVDKSDQIWDGNTYVYSSGPVFKGYKQTINLNNDRMTNDHKVLTKSGWQEAQRGEWKVPEKDLERLQRPSYNWTDVWAMARSVGRSADIRALPKNICRLWLRAGVEVLRQFTRRKI